MKQILIFILFAGLLCWLMFAPVYKHVLIVRQAVLQKEVDYLLEIGASGSRGYIDAAMIEQSRMRLVERGFDESKLIYTVQTTSGADATDPSSPVMRGTGILLHLAYPIENLMAIDRLAGIPVPSSESLLSAGGMKMSEFVP